MTQEAVAFFERPYPSANAALLRGERPILVDSGFGSDVGELEAWLQTQGVSPQHLALVVNTHHHSDHVGGNHALQQRYALPVAAHAWEADLVNRRDPEACVAAWLRQPVEQYRVNRELREGDVLDTGSVTWQVLHTPGHTLGHVSLYARQEQVLVVGDAVHLGDVGWLNPYREGVNALGRAVETLDRLSELDVRLAFPGHGPALHNPSAVFAAGRARLEAWRAAPEKIAWHACKRIFAFALMIEGGQTEAEVERYLLSSPWCQDHATHAFGLEPYAFVPLLLQEMVRSGAAQWQDGRLVAHGEHRMPQPGWASGATAPGQW